MDDHSDYNKEDTDLSQQLLTAVYFPPANQYTTRSSINEAATIPYISSEMRRNSLWMEEVTQLPSAILSQGRNHPVSRISMNSRVNIRQYVT